MSHYHDLPKHDLPTRKISRSAFRRDRTDLGSGFCSRSQTSNGRQRPEIVRCVGKLAFVGFLCYEQEVSSETKFRTPFFVSMGAMLPPEVDYQGMRKRLIATTSQVAPHLDEGWLDLESAAMVEVTSEEKDYPVEFALVSGEVRGWRAAASGTQTIRLIFDQPQSLTRISLVFEETETERTQEFVIQWSPDGGRSFREIVRQQWNFSPRNTTREIEEYNVQLTEVTVLELVIVPDINRGAAHASLKNLRVS